METLKRMIQHLFGFALFLFWTWKFDFFEVDPKFSILWYCQKSYVYAKIKTYIYYIFMVWYNARLSKWNFSLFPNLAYPNLYLVGSKKCTLMCQRILLCIFLPFWTKRWGTKHLMQRFLFIEIYIFQLFNIFLHKINLI